MQFAVRLLEEGKIKFHEPMIDTPEEMEGKFLEQLKHFRRVFKKTSETNFSAHEPKLPYT